MPALLNRRTVPRTGEGREGRPSGEIKDRNFSHARSIKASLCFISGSPLTDRRSPQMILSCQEDHFMPCGYGAKSISEPTERKLAEQLDASFKKVIDLM